MEAATLVVLCELLDSDDEKPTRGKTRNWIKRREERGYFSNIVQELKIEDRLGFKDMFRVDVTDFEYVLSVIAPLITPKKIIGGHKPISPEERLTLAIRYLATGESFQSLSYQFRISLNAVSYIIKGCCKAIVEKLVPLFVKSPASKQ